MMRFSSPDTPPVGRQPDTIMIIPSKRQYWYGVILEGERYTRQQLGELARRGLDPDALPSLTVKRQATDREMWWPIGSLPPVYAFECPVLGPNGNRVLVITPSGYAKTVDADGWAHRPYRKPKREPYG